VRWAGSVHAFGLAERGLTNGGLYLRCTSCNCRQEVTLDAK